MSTVILFFRFFFTFILKIFNSPTAILSIYLLPDPVSSIPRVATTEIPVSSRSPFIATPSSQSTPPSPCVPSLYPSISPSVYPTFCAHPLYFLTSFQSFSILSICPNHCNVLLLVRPITSTFIPYCLLSFSSLLFL